MTIDWTAEQDELFHVLAPLIEASLLDGVDEARGQLPEGVEIDWALVNEAARKQAEAYTYDLVTGITDTTRGVLREKVSAWVASGEPLSALTDALAPWFGEYRARLIAASEVTSAFFRGNRDSWKAAGLNQFRFNTVRDGDVCDICQPYDQQIYDLDDTEHSPSIHPGCRCYAVPVVNV